MNGCSACLYDEHKGALSERSLKMSRGQAEQLIPLIDSALQDADISYDYVDMIAVTKGPGAFTGMRIGLATAKALALALDIPVRGVSTFEAIFESYMLQDNREEYPYYGALLETKRSDYYFQLFDGKTKQPCSAGAALNVQDILHLIDGRECLILGDAAGRFQSETTSDHKYKFHDIDMPSPLAVARLALSDNIDGNNDCRPVYLREPEIGTPKTQPRKINYE